MYLQRPFWGAGFPFHEQPGVDSAAAFFIKYVTAYGLWAITKDRVYKTL
jgi:hypothetical protein